jgi:phosphate:Na+ symporter
MDVEIDYWVLLAGLGIFLFGMLLLEESIRELSGSAFKRLIGKYTNNRWKALFTGTIATSILQSSSAVSLMVLAFVGAGIMTLSSGIGVIIGSNLGTTVTSWIVATIGFKISIEALALPFLGVGGLGLIFFGNNTKATNFSKLLVGFGFLFMGLDYMKKSMEAFAAGLDPELFLGYNLITYLIIGFILTALVQSSSASMAIILSIVYSGLIDYTSACAMVIGTNMGTTITVLLGSINASQDKKRVAFGHFIFNFLTGIIAIILIIPISRGINFNGWANNDPVMGLAAFHTTFNLLGAFFFIPFLGLLTKVVYKLVPEKIQKNTRYISNVTMNVPEAGLASLRKESKRLFKMSAYFQLKILGMRVSSQLLPGFTDKNHLEKFKKLSTQERYDLLLHLQNEINEFGSYFQKKSLNPEEGKELQSLLYSCQLSIYAAKSFRDDIQDIQNLQEEDDEDVAEVYRNLKEEFSNCLKDLIETDNSPESYEETISKWQIQLVKTSVSLYQELSEKTRNQDVKAEHMSRLVTFRKTQELTLQQMFNALRELGKELPKSIQIEETI